MGQWFSDIYQDGELRGPALGASLAAAASVYASMGSSIVDALYSFMAERQNLTIRDAFGPGVHYTADLIPGHFGFPYVNAQAVSLGAPHYTFKRGPLADTTDVVVIGKFPGEMELQTGYLFSGPSGVELRQALFEAEAEKFLDNAYITNLVRFAPPHGKIKQSFIRECEWLLWAELALIKPKLVILFGAEAIKHFHGKSASVTSTRGVILPYRLQLGNDKWLEFMTIGTMHPAAVAREPTLRNGLAGDLARAQSALRGVVRKQHAWDYRILSTLADVTNYVDTAIKAGHKQFAIDCEWHGRSPHAGGVLLTVQISHANGHAVLIPFHRHARLAKSAVANSTPVPRHTHFSTFDASIIPAHVIVLDKSRCVGQWLALTTDLQSLEPEVEVLNALVSVFGADQTAVVAQLKRLFERPDVGIGGHHFRADWPWLVRLGVDVVQPFLNGFDTMIKHHMRWESSKQDLTTLTLKYTDMDRYDVNVFDHLTSFKPLGGDADAGFGLVPEDELYPYALRDVDATFRINVCLDEEYSRDTAHQKNMLSRVRDEQLACVGIAEMEANGLAVDRERIMQLARMYTDKRTELDAALRQQISWPDFNYRSPIQTRELLFGELLSGKRDPNGTAIRLRPEGAVCCALTPIKTTGKPAKAWEQVVGRGEELQYSPSTDKESLGILGDIHPAAAALRKLRFVDQVVKLYTALPTHDEDTGEDVESGLLAYVDPDGRIRTSIFQTTETGRWSSARPNLQNIPKRREPELHKLFPPDKKPYCIRSVFVASPGHVLVQADYKQAELLTLAVVSGDQKFWKTLTESPTYKTLVRPDGKRYWLHPSYVRGMDVKEGDVIPRGALIGEYSNERGQWVGARFDEDLTVATARWSRDLHAERAIAGFQMPYSGFLHGPPKPFVENGFEDRRVAAKTVNFGIPYGRGASAIAREVRQEGVMLADTDAQTMIDGFLAEFDLVRLFLDKCKWCATNLGYVVNALGRVRRFPRTDDRKLIVANEREASNFPIQSFVAECLNKATWNFWNVRRQLALRGQHYSYRLLVGVHDAMLLECPVAEIAALMAAGGIVDYCMTQAARIPCPDKTVCDGLYANVNDELFANGGFALDTDKGLFLRWDEKPTAEDLAAVGVAEQFWPKKKK